MAGSWPKTRVGRRSKSNEIARPKGYYKELINKLGADGFTPPQRSDNTKKSRRTVWRMLERFCAKLDKTVEQLLKGMTSKDVKGFFAWFEDTHQDWVENGSKDSINSYWRILKTYYVQYNGHDMDKYMTNDCLNYKNKTIKSMKLRKLPRRKPCGDKDDLYRALLVNWERCKRTYADEKQRVYVATGLLLSFISGCRPVSLFDTRIKIDEKKDGSKQIQESRTCPSPIGQQSSAQRTSHSKDDLRSNPKTLKTSKTGTKRKRDKTPSRDEEEDDGPRPSNVKRRRHLPPRARVRVSKAQRGISNDADDADVEGGTSDTEYSDPGYSGDDDDDVMMDVDDDEAITSDDNTSGDTTTSNDKGSLKDGYDSGYGSDPNPTDRDFIEDVTDDEYDAGPEKTGALLWRHISFYIIRSPVPGRPNIMIAKITLLHTKNEERKPRVKTFVIGHHPDPILDLLDHLLSMAIHDRIFKIDVEDFERVYWFPISSHRYGVQLKIRSEKLDLPVFRQPINGRTSEEEPMTYQQWYSYLRALGIEMGGKDPLTGYVWRRGLINAINNKAPSSVRDQVADHESNAVRYYLDTEVRFHLQAAALEMNPRDSNETAQKIARRYLFNGDATAPTELPEDLKQRIKNDPVVVELSQRNAELTQLIHELGYRPISRAKGKTPLYDDKKRVEAELNREKNMLHKDFMELARKRHFRNADTERLNKFLNGEASEESLNNILPPPPPLQISQRAAVVDMMRKGVAHLSEEENFKLRFTFIYTLVELQDRKEAQRRGRHRHQQPVQQNVRPPSPMVVIYTKNAPPEESYRTERFLCPFCAANTGLPDSARYKDWGRANKLWNHMECREHKADLQEYSFGQKPCGLCKEYVPSGTDDFKLHTWKVHNMRFRGLDKRSFPS